MLQRPKAMRALFFIIFVLAVLYFILLQLQFLLEKESGKPGSLLR
ncbi:hypothetical protein MJ1HA_2485 [Metallosphaera sedula]|nr:hypothetical protein MJ1HA_2485 [Metallosphaera sedula]